ncbi:Ankyrin repeat and SOCS box protein 10 [Galemys pyrenaicus]|uniref:Ankyrin repeat and SOCS box protein 10 n=1 Tax=Galemys pyrenaicus TaxID=202257 RepID=A0A8J6DFD8_GALPY|nr:Ankyrin repeat and SOCS box protein 10 [Galemys pyrenaicus]
MGLLCRLRLCGLCRGLGEGGAELITPCHERDMSPAQPPSGNHRARGSLRLQSPPSPRPLACLCLHLPPAQADMELPFHPDVLMLGEAQGWKFEVSSFSTPGPSRIPRPRAILPCTAWVGLFMAGPCSLPLPRWPQLQEHGFWALPELAMPGRSSPGHWGHRPSTPACLAWGPPRPSLLLCRDMALQNALYTGNLARLQELFPPHSTADLLLESRVAEPRWSSHHPEGCREPGEPHDDRHALCARLVERPHSGPERPEPGPGPIATRTASGPALALWEAVLDGDAGSVSRILADASTGLAPDCVFDTSDPERWRDFRFNIRALRLWSLTYEEELTTPLHVAASRGHAEVLKLLLRRRARPDCAPGGHTALHEACAGGHATCVRVLLAAGADPNIPDQDGKRPLHLCRGPGALECAELLMRFGASVDGRSEEDDETPLHVAARLGHVELAELLLQWGACSNAHDAEGWTLLLAACDVRCPSPVTAAATAARCLQLCHLLLAAGADADAADRDQQRPLHAACRRGHAAVVGLLLSCGASANAMDYGGHTPLHCALQGPAAALAQSPERTVRALLNHGAVRVWPGALPKVRGWGRRGAGPCSCPRWTQPTLGSSAVLSLSQVLERWCTSPRTIEVLMNTYSVVQLPEEARALVPPETQQKHHHFYSSLFALVRQPRSLQHLSRCALRTHLATCLPHALPRLPLPPRLLRYLQLEFEDVLY